MRYVIYVDVETKEKIKIEAKKRRWKASQMAGILLKEYFEMYDVENVKEKENE